MQSRLRYKSHTCFKKADRDDGDAPQVTQPYKWVGLIPNYTKILIVKHLNFQMTNDAVPLFYSLTKTLIISLLKPKLRCTGHDAETLNPKKRTISHC